MAQVCLGRSRPISWLALSLVGADGLWMALPSPLCVGLVLPGVPDDLRSSWFANDAGVSYLLGMMVVKAERVVMGGTDSPMPIS